MMIIRITENGSRIILVIEKKKRIKSRLKKMFYVKHLNIYKKKNKTKIHKLILLSFFTFTFQLMSIQVM